MAVLVGSTSNAATTDLAQRNLAFALDLYAEVKGKGNVFFSPYSISTALAMTYAGAAGRTVAPGIENGTKNVQAFSGMMDKQSDIFNLRIRCPADSTFKSAGDRFLKVAVALHALIIRAALHLLPRSR